MSKIRRVSRSRLGGPFVVAPTLTRYGGIGGDDDYGGGFWVEVQFGGIWCP